MTRKSNRFWKFLSYFRPYKRILIADIACAMVAAAAALLVPLVVRYITKDILEYGALDALPAITRAGLLMLLLVLVGCACTYYYDYRGHAMGAMMERDLRAELFSHLERLSFTYHDEQKPGQLLSRLTNDLLNLAELYHHGPEELAINVVKFSGALFILMRTSAPLAWVVIAFLPVIAVFSLLIGRRMYAKMTRNLEAIGDVNAMLEENLSGIKVVQSFAGEQIEVEKFAVQNDRYLESRKGIYRIEAVFSTGIILLTELITVAVVVLGGIAITRASLDLADLLTFLLYVGYLVQPMSRLAFTVNQYQSGIAGFHRFADLMAIAPDIQEKPDAIALDAPSGHVQFDHVTFRYRPELPPVLKDIALDVHPGETVAIVGYSGVGKTTLCSLLPRFYEATAGRILIDGMDIRDVTLRSLRQNIGVVEQDVYLFSGSVMENIRYGLPGASDAAVREAARRANAHAFIEALPQGYHTDIGHRGVKLSGGQRQRISIARVFLKNPPVLILDEATSALDGESERVVQASLEALSLDRTTFVIAHRLSTIHRADRIIVLSEDGIAEEGTHAALLERGGLYAQLYRSQPIG